MQLTPRAVVLAVVGVGPFLLTAGCGESTPTGAGATTTSIQPTSTDVSIDPAPITSDEPEPVAVDSTTPVTTVSLPDSTTVPRQGSVTVPEFPAGPSYGGRELGWFLGSVLPPDVLIAAQHAHLGAVMQCMAREGFDLPFEPLEYSEELRLRYEDPVAFAQSYGYGYFTMDVDRVASADELAAELPEVTAPADDWLAASDNCAARNPYPLIENVASVGVANLAYELQLELLASDPVYLAAVDAWIECMARHDLSITTADGAWHLMAARVDEFPDTSGVESDLATYIISDAELAELVRFERSLYEIDTACGQESGRYEAERGIDRRVIGTIRTETGYDGVDLEPAT